MSLFLDQMLLSKIGAVTDYSGTNPISTVEIDGISRPISVVFSSPSPEYFVDDFFSGITIMRGRPEYAKERFVSQVTLESYSDDMVFVDASGYDGLYSDNEWYVEASGGLLGPSEVSLYFVPIPIWENYTISYRTNYQSISEAIESHLLKKIRPHDFYNLTVGDSSVVCDIISNSPQSLDLLARVATTSSKKRVFGTQFNYKILNYIVDDTILRTNKTTILRSIDLNERNISLS